MYSIKNARKIKKKNPTAPARIALRFALYLMGRRVFASSAIFNDFVPAAKSFISPTSEMVFTKTELLPETRRSISSPRTNRKTR